MAIFLDTGFFMALVNKKDKYYQRSLELLEQLSTGEYGQICTSIYVLSETFTLVSVRTSNNHIALNEIKDLFIGNNNFFTIYRTNNNLETQIIDLFIKLNSKRKETISFVDCSNIIYCREYGFEYMVSYDKHFDGFINRVY